MEEEGCGIIKNINNMGPILFIDCFSGKKSISTFLYIIHVKIFLKNHLLVTIEITSL